MVQFSPRKIRRIESILAEREFWMTAGDLALARHQNLQPHRHVSLSLVARLFDLASKLGRLAVGMELQPSHKNQPPPEAFPSWRRNMAEELRRTYGGPEQISPPSATFA